MRKLLIAEHSNARIDALSKVLQQDWEIHTCVDSYPVIDTLRYIKPEAMIINLNIGPKDGASISRPHF